MRAELFRRNRLSILLLLFDGIESQNQEQELRYDWIHFGIKTAQNSD